MILEIPGMVDPHVHLRDLDWSQKATFASETAAALAGGYWAVLDMPNTPPEATSREALDVKLQRISASAACDWGLYFGASQAGNEGEYPRSAGDCCGLKVYCNATTGKLLVEEQERRESHFRAWPTRKVIAVHAENETVAEILQIIRRCPRPTHFCHVSTAREMGLLRAAKEERLPISVGVTPHHLYLTAGDARALGSFGLMKPELKTPADRDALWRGIAEGVVDVVESDHAPHTIEEKRSARPPFGVPGLETTLPLMGLAVLEGRIAPDRLVQLLAENPRRIFGLRCPPNTFTRIDLAERFTLDRARLKTLCGWSPFEGMCLAGRVLEVRIRGRLAYDGENARLPPGGGVNVAVGQDSSSL